MKKLTLALALILCLVLCVFAFASCGPKKPASTTAKGTAPASTTAKTECNHVWGEFEVDTPATCSAPGVKSRYCTLCDAQDPDSITAIPTIPHTPGEEFVVDTEPTCTDGGFKSKHCTVCGLPVADTVLPIDPDPSKHNVDAWDTEDIPTLLNKTGSRDGVCTLCSQPVHEVLTWEFTAYNSKSPSGPYASNKDFTFGKKVDAIRGDKHFYPTVDDPDGNDLWFEYSFLWNDTLTNWDVVDSLAEMKIVCFRDLNVWDTHREFYYLYMRDNNAPFKTSNDCPFTGHFDYSTYKSDDLEANNAVDLTSEGNTLFGDPVGKYVAGWGSSPKQRSYSPYIFDSEKEEGGFGRGWHRIGVRYHQEVASISGDTITYDAYAELYINGVKVWKLLVNTNTLKNKGTTGGLLLWNASTEEQEGYELGANGLYYKDNDIVRVEARLGQVTQATEAMYIAVDDIQWTCGDGFVRDVEPVDTPAESTVTLYEDAENAENNIVVSDAIFFKLK